MKGHFKTYLSASGRKTLYLTYLDVLQGTWEEPVDDSFDKEVDRELQGMWRRLEPEDLPRLLLEFQNTNNPNALMTILGDAASNWLQRKT